VLADPISGLVAAGAEPAHDAGAGGLREGAEFDPTRELALGRCRELIDAFQPDRTAARRVTNGFGECRSQRGDRHPRFAGDVGEATARVATKAVDVMGQQPLPGPLFAQDQQRDVSQVGIQRAQQLGQCEIRKPAGETLCDGVTGRALRKRNWTAAARSCCARAAQSDLCAQRAGVGWIAQDRCVDPVESLAGCVDQVALGHQDPVRVGRAHRGPMGEFQLGLEIPAQAEQHDVGQRCRAEDRISRSATNGVFGSPGSPDEC